MWWHVVTAVAVSLAVAWILLLVVLWRVAPSKTSLQEALRLLPDVLRLVRRLASDRTLARGIRLRMWLALAYLASPIDLIPDFIPVLGYADDAIVVVLAVRSAVRRAGLAALEQHWPGTPDGLAVVMRLTGVST